MGIDGKPIRRFEQGSGTMTHQLQQEANAVMADLEARNVLYPVPPDLPPAAALVRLPGGMVGEVVLWLDRNPEGTQWFSNLRVVLVELIDSVIDQTTSNSLDHRRAFTEDDITVLRSQPTEAAMQRWLKRWHGLRPELNAGECASCLMSGAYA
jgi:hypothetical protein